MCVCVCVCVTVRTVSNVNSECDDMAHDFVFDVLARLPPPAPPHPGGTAAAVARVRLYADLRLNTAHALQPLPRSGDLPAALGSLDTRASQRTGLFDTRARAAGGVCACAGGEGGWRTSDNLFVRSVGGGWRAEMARVTSFL